MLKELMFWTVRDWGEAPGAVEYRKEIFESGVFTILQQAI